MTLTHPLPAAAALCAGVGLIVLTAARRAVPPAGDARGTQLSTLSFTRWLAIGAAAAVGLLAQWVSGPRLVLVVIALGGAFGVAHLVRQQRAAARADRVAGLLIGVCDGMAADLAAGQTPEAALTRAAGEWPPLVGAASAAGMGGDVVAVLRTLAELPGADCLRAVAAAWQVSHRSGSGLASALADTVRLLRERRRTTQLVSSELASARATAHLMAVLPFGVLALGSGVGGDPIGFLLDTPAGLGCLGFGVLLTLTGLVWLQQISVGVQRS